MPFELPSTPPASTPDSGARKRAASEGGIKGFLKDVVLWSGVMLSSLPLVKLHEAAGTWRTSETQISKEVERVESDKAREVAPEIVHSGLVYGSMEIPGAENGNLNVYVMGIDRRGTADPRDDYSFYGLVTKTQEKKANDAGVTMTMDFWDSRMEIKGVRPAVAMEPSLDMPLEYYTDDGTFVGQDVLDSLEKKTLAYDAIQFSVGTAGNAAAEYLAGEILMEADAFHDSFPQAQLTPSFQKHLKEMRGDTGQMASR